MLPALTMIIGAYVVLRCLQIATKNKDSFVNPGARVIVIICSALVAVVTIMETMSVQSSALPASNQPEQRGAQ